MDDKVRVSKIAAHANRELYSHENRSKYTNGSPHIKHAQLHALYRRLVVEIYTAASSSVSHPKVLDIGAGEGSVSLAFLEMGAKTTAVDISEAQLGMLKKRCSSFAQNLTICCGDINDVIKEFIDKKAQFDIIVMNSFLHHIPDYLSLIKQCSKILSPDGHFFSFQDPIKYTSLSKFTDVFSKVAYYSCRIFKGDVIGGIQRKIRRSRGIYIDDCPQDNSEYHVVRGGVDQDAIVELFKGLDFDCQIIPYFSTQSRFWQLIGSAIKSYNTFSIIARKQSV